MVTGAQGEARDLAGILLAASLNTPGLQTDVLSYPKG